MVQFHIILTNVFYLVVDEAVVDEQLVAVAANATATFVNIHGQIEIRL